LLPSQWALFEAIASVGGSVVLNAAEPGERCLLPPLPELPTPKGTLTGLADHYFDHAVDVFHRPNSRLYAWLKPRLAERRVRGIVLWVHVGCDLWRAEAANLREAFGLPLLVLEAHEVHAGGLRDANRLAAFVESLQ
jgi:benzoyl-CoA reductase/2-hydroxyglutaryl-CoA dehydratase subunit BcrC/BadD/HgdB